MVEPIAGWLLLDLDPFTLLAPNSDFVLARDKYDMSVIISNVLGETVYHSDAASGRVSGFYKLIAQFVFISIMRIYLSQTLQRI